MIVRASFSALYVLALALGLGAVYARGLRLRDLRSAPTDAAVLARLFRADSIWGVAAILWIVTGLVRAFGRLEKQPDFYLRNGFFWVKMALFALVFALEIRPMMTFIRWRKEKSHGKEPAIGANFDALIAINNAEVVLVVVIPFAAALMARGAWLF